MAKSGGGAWGSIDLPVLVAGPKVHFTVGHTPTSTIVRDKLYEEALVKYSSTTLLLFRLLTPVSLLCIEVTAIEGSTCQLLSGGDISYVESGYILRVTCFIYTHTHQSWNRDGHTGSPFFQEYPRSSTQQSMPEG